MQTYTKKVIEYYDSKGRYKTITISEKQNEFYTEESNKALYDDTISYCTQQSPTEHDPNPLMPWGCSRPKGHKGLHVAVAGDVTAMWEEQDGVQS